jgi:hypothetical protein
MKKLKAGLFTTKAQRHRVTKTHEKTYKKRDGKGQMLEARSKR